MTTNQYGKYMTMDDSRRSGQSSINDNQQNSSSGKKIAFNFVLILVLFAIGGAIYYFGFYKRENIEEEDSNGNPVDSNDSNSYQPDAEYQTALSKNEDDYTDIPVSSASSNHYANDEATDPPPTSSSPLTSSTVNPASEITIEPYEGDFRDLFIDNHYEFPQGTVVESETKYLITLSGKKLPNTNIGFGDNIIIQDEITVDKFFQYSKMHCMQQLYNETGVQHGYFKDSRNGEKVVVQVNDKDTYLDHAFFTYTPSTEIETINGNPTIRVQLHIKEAAPTDLVGIRLTLTTGPYEPEGSCYKTDFLGLVGSKALEIIMERYHDVISQVEIFPMGSMVNSVDREDRVKLYVNVNDEVVKVTAPGIPEIEGEKTLNVLGYNGGIAKSEIMEMYGNVITEVVIIPMGSIVTGDYREDRVRLYVDDNDKVVKVEAPGIPSIEGESQVPVTDVIVSETIDYPSSSNSSKTYTVEESKSDNEAEQLLINRLNTKMSHEGYRCYTKRNIPGSLSGPKELAHTDSCNKSCSCTGLNCGARNNVKTQVLTLSSENQITQDQADRFITNLRLENHPNCV